MKTLYIVRHAKSSWNQNNVMDYDRSLNERGRNDVKLMAKRLKKEKLKWVKFWQVHPSELLQQLLD